MIDLRAPAETSADGRRFVCCVLVAATLHAVGGISPRRLTWRRHTEAAPAPLRTLVPVSFEETLVPVEPERVTSPTPPPPDLAPPPPRAPVAPPDGDKPRRRPEPVAAVAPPRRSDPPKPRKREAKTADAASPFSGKDGAFHARVCLLEPTVRSALAVENCEAVARFRTNAIDVAPQDYTKGFPGHRKRGDFFGIEYRGRFKVRAAGYYTFRLLSDDGALLYIDGEQVIDNDGLHRPRSKKMSLPLGQGEHELRLLYYQGVGYELALQLFVKGYKTEERLFGPEI
ncbi:MAG TPA: PA14 domain-containing protein [Polyangiaceae bacterium]|nr:PA14 domain-containing protein [Polyangiaceae bacterium]